MSELRDELRALLAAEEDRVRAQGGPDYDTKCECGNRGWANIGGALQCAFCREPYDVEHHVAQVRADVEEQLMQLAEEKMGAYSAVGGLFDGTAIMNAVGTEDAKDLARKAKLDPRSTCIHDMVLEGLTLIGRGWVETEPYMRELRDVLGDEVAGQHWSAAQRALYALALHLEQERDRRAATPEPEEVAAV